MREILCRNEGLIERALSHCLQSIFAVHRQEKYHKRRSNLLFEKEHQHAFDVSQHTDSLLNLTCLVHADPLDGQCFARPYPINHRHYGPQFDLRSVHLFGT